MVVSLSELVEVELLVVDPVGEVLVLVELLIAVAVVFPL